MSYSQRIARVLTKLQEELDVDVYLKLLKRLQSANAFEELTEDDQNLIKQMEKKL